MICNICKRDLCETRFPLRDSGRSAVCGDCLLSRGKQKSNHGHYTEKELARYIRDATGLKESEICDVYKVDIDFVRRAKRYEV